jgi:hypothetical protein
MFEQTFVDGVGKTNKSWTVMVSFIGQIVLILIAVILPLIYTEVLPSTWWRRRRLLLRHRLRRLRLRSKWSK